MIEVIMKDNIIEVAWAAEDVAIIKIVGRGSFQNSLDLRNASSNIQGKNPRVKLIIDLNDCIAMDSTFMGTLAEISTGQNCRGHGYLTVVNAKDHTHELLANLGLKYILDMREPSSSEMVKEEDFQVVDKPAKTPKFEQIVHMINAHKTLINVDNKNQVIFQSVIKYLEDSLEREKKKQAEDDSR